MTRTKTVPFAEFRQFLLSLGYTETRTASAHVFKRANKDPLFFRLYRDQEDVDQSDLVSTRKFLDLWGLLETAEFDSFLEARRYDSVTACANGHFVFALASGATARQSNSCWMKTVRAK